MSKFHKLSIKNIIRETPKAVSIEFDVPAKLKGIYSFFPGQYITLKTNVNGKEVRRAYSICSSPKSGVLKVVVKEIENGTFSVYANSALKIGDIIEVNQPEGSFVLRNENSSNKTFVAFAAGSGITPIMSMIKSVLQDGANSRFLLVYGNKTPEDVIFLKELSDLKIEYPDRFFIEYIYSRVQEKDCLFGRIEESTVNYIVKNKYKNHSFETFFLCGPEVMIDTVSEVLIKNDFNKNKIHFELFTNSSKVIEMDANIDGKSNITILVDDEESSFIMDQKKTILDAALTEDIDVPYSCQGGVCSSCICRILEGSAIMKQNSILTDSELAEGLILACQAHPTSSSIKIDFDDV